ncbi:hypothetical protein OE749_04840 [Aestuariibacter sp. AA17]|uniref:EF-hand domain-containing protein n=1 Tax=Fluctibacter corallii TaxID=2984329 RepID=A0ABT3A5S8_9ALTE|nr:hypothetical protein [Aestuariibacter sp. AA17]MCV2884014.1 hypothetical protein [Aestuariibacter sp. AA17]
MKTFTLATLLTFVSAFALANPAILTELDSNNDGKLSKEEAAHDATLAADFAKLDVNGDGFLTKDELAG